MIIAVVKNTSENNNDILDVNKSSHMKFSRFSAKYPLT